LIFFLQRSEVERLISGGAEDMKEQAAARLRAWRQQHQLQAPPAIPHLTDPAWKDGRALEFSNRVLHRLAVSQDKSPGVLPSLPASPGRASGRASVLRREDEFDRLERGDILVAVTTNPAWTPLFTLADGVVTEVGVLLAHASIVAREFGAPAVVATQNATSAIRDGEIITVDGSAGLVYLHPQA
jgi:pyruvate,water dikinase